MTDLVEKVARAILEVQGCNPDVDHGDGVPWWHDYKPEARAAIAIVRAAVIEECSKEIWRIYDATPNGHMEFYTALLDAEKAIRALAKGDETNA